MLDLLKYTLSSFWIFCGSYLFIAMILYFLVNGTVLILKAILRSVTIICRGWSPSHLDCDGDFKTNS